MNIGQKLAPYIMKTYVNWISPASMTVRGPRFAPIPRQVIERCGDLADVTARSRGMIEASILSAAAPGVDHHLGQFVPLDLVLGWKGLAEPLGRRAVGEVEQQYGDAGERCCTTQEPISLPWLLASLCFAPTCPPLSLEDCRLGRTVELYGFEVDIKSAAGEWLGNSGERSMLIYVTAWRLSRWWGSTPGDHDQTSMHRAGIDCIATQRLTAS